MACMLNPESLVGSYNRANCFSGPRSNWIALHVAWSSSSDVDQYPGCGEVTVPIIRSVIRHSLELTPLAV